MKSLPVLFVALLACPALFSQSGPDAMLPDYDDIPGWRRAGEPKYFNSATLAALEEDESKLVLEYGFDLAVLVDYYNFRNKIITVQVYTMKNTMGSYGLFLRKSKNGKVFMQYGNSSYEKPGELAFWKHYYFIRMTSAASGDTITEGFRLIAAYIDTKIRSKGTLPEILDYSKDKPGKVTLFGGPLGLSEIYYFSPLNIFSVREGMAIENGEEKEIILRYADNNEAVRRLTDVAGILSSMNKFSGFIMAGDFSFAMKDREGKTLVFKVDGDCLNITVK